ncbi:glycosyltransferase family 4 protein [Clostridium aestuarii]|uniref:Glycosyltransferase family 4 protein n=1 Tax=Clostridium aestuarii TaxID=338193 RepID=A0ABT4CZ91_9CLOT|nr:glycosyltransferase family 4 protein [Clostridium aestuarii]MCY6484299.1 glycosyltransferase family 4 protein [Clostridium aestuarii]
MKILMLSLGYSSKDIEGTAKHVYYLSHSLAQKGHEVHVITCENGTLPIYENDEGVEVYRISPYKIDTNDFTKWIMQLNFAIVEQAIRLIRKHGMMDVIHAHDWTTAYAVKTLKWSLNIPIISTIHSTEYVRNNGIKTEMQRYISSVEWMLIHESCKVIVFSNYIRNEIKSIFKTPQEKIWIIPNGINTKETKIKFEDFRRDYAEEDEKVILYVGRCIFEQDKQLLINSIYEINKKYNKIKFIISAKDNNIQELKEDIRNIGMENKVLFINYMDDDKKKKLYKISNLVVFLSHYESLEVSVLEAMVAGCPVVVPDNAAFPELVEHQINGMKFIKEIYESLNNNIIQILSDDKFSNSLKKNALKSICEKHKWNKVTNLTLKLYKKVIDEVKNIK